jgi:hypothetical protein
VDQASFGELSWHMQYAFYPALDMQQPYSVRKSENEVVAEGRKNSYAVVIPPEKYYQRLLQSQVVYCHNVDDYFRKNYGRYFADPLINGRVYRQCDGCFHLMPLQDVVFDFKKFNYMEPQGASARFKHKNGKLRFKVFDVTRFMSSLKLNELIAVVNGTRFRQMVIKMSVEGEKIYCALWDGNNLLVDKFILAPGKYEKVIELQPRVLGSFKLDFFTQTGKSVVEIDEIRLRGEWSQKKDGK